MKEKYTLNNSSSLLFYGFAVIIVLIWIITNLINNNYQMAGIGIIILIGVSIVLIRRLNNHVIELELDKNRILKKKYFSDKKSGILNYSDINSISIREILNQGTTIIEFNTMDKKGQKKIKMDLPGNTEEIVEFVLWLKQRNPDIQTFVIPKGTQLHTRLRQELLGFEY